MTTKNSPPLMPLVAAAQQGDEEARNELLITLSPIIRERYATSPKLRIRPDEVDDFTHAVLVQVPEYLESFDGSSDGEFLGWVWGIARIVSVPYRTPHTSDVEPDDLASTPSAKSRIPFRDMRAAVELLVRAGVSDQIHRRVWTILTLDPTCQRDDLAEHLGLNSGTVRSILSRTNIKVRDYLGGRSSGGADD